MPRGAPHPRKGSAPAKPKVPRRRWTATEESRLRVHFATFGDDWDEIIAALGKEGWVRTELAVVNKVVDLGLRSHTHSNST